VEAKNCYQDVKYSNETYYNYKLNYVDFAIDLLTRLYSYCRICFITRGISFFRSLLTFGVFSGVILVPKRVSAVTLRWVCWQDRLICIILANKKLIILTGLLHHILHIRFDISVKIITGNAWHGIYIKCKLIIITRLIFKSSNVPKLFHSTNRSKNYTLIFDVEPRHRTPSKHLPKPVAILINFVDKPIGLSICYVEFSIRTTIYIPKVSVISYHIWADAILKHPNNNKSKILFNKNKLTIEFNILYQLNAICLRHLPSVIIVMVDLYFLILVHGDNKMLSQLHIH
jgi:hypothetical protein